MRVQALYQECRAQHSWLPSNRRTPDIFLGSQSIPLHQAVKPTILADRLHTTRPPSDPSRKAKLRCQERAKTLGRLVPMT